MNILTKQVQIAYNSIVQTPILSVSDVMNGLKWICNIYDICKSDMTPAARQYCKMTVEYLYLSLSDLVQLRGNYYTVDDTGCTTDFIIALRKSKLGKLLFRDPDYRYIILGGKKGVDYNARD